MAKKWTPTQRQLTIYDELLRRQNITRKRLLKQRRIAEEGGGRASLPDLIIPKKARRYRDFSRYHFDSYEDYRKMLSRLKEFSDFERSWSREHYQKRYAETILEFIAFYISQENPRIQVYDRDDPNKRLILHGEGARGRFTEEQLNDPDFAKYRDYLEFYNKIVYMPIDLFMTMYQSGIVPQLKLLYDEIGGKELGMLDRYQSEYKSFRNELAHGGNVMINNLRDFTKMTRLYDKGAKDWNRHHRNKA